MKRKLLIGILICTFLLSACARRMQSNQVIQPASEKKYEVIEVNPEVPSDFYYYHDGIGLCEYNKKTCYLDENGKVFIEPGAYIDGLLFSEGIALVYTEKGITYSASQAAIIDKNGKILHSLNRVSRLTTKKEYWEFSEGKAVLTLADKDRRIATIVIDKNGNTLFSIPYKDGLRSTQVDLEFSCERLVYYVSGNRYGEGGIKIFNAKGDILDLNFTPVYTHKKYSDDLLVITDDTEKWGVIDKNGNVKIKFEHEKLGNANHGLIPFLKYGKWGYMDYNGNVVIEPTYIKAGDFSQGLAAVETESKMVSYIDVKGNVVIDSIVADQRLVPADYDSMEDFNFFDSGYAVAGNLIIDKNSAVVFDNKTNIVISYFGGDIFSIGEKIYKIKK